MAEAAELGADHRVGAELGRGDPVVGHDPGDGVDLHPPRRDPEVVQDVGGPDVELDRLALGHVELGRRELLAASR